MSDPMFDYDHTLEACAWRLTSAALALTLIIALLPVPWRTDTPPAI